MTFMLYCTRRVELVHTHTLADVYASACSEFSGELHSETRQRAVARKADSSNVSGEEVLLYAAATPATADCLYVLGKIMIDRECFAAIRFLILSGIA